MDQAIMIESIIVVGLGLIMASLLWAFVDRMRYLETEVARLHEEITLESTRRAIKCSEMHQWLARQEERTKAKE